MTRDRRPNANIPTSSADTNFHLRQVTETPEAAKSFDSSHVSGGLHSYAGGKTIEALWQFFEAAADNPKDPLCHYLCGLALRALGLQGEARSEWQTVLSVPVPQSMLTPKMEANALPDPQGAWARIMAERLLQEDIQNVETISRSDRRRQDHV